MKISVRISALRSHWVPQAGPDIHRAKPRFQERFFNRSANTVLVI